mgnify:CR=1 FL=1
MKCVSLLYGGKAWEWVQLGPSRWGLVGHKAEVFYAEGRGWGVMAEGQFVGYYRRRERAMQAALDMLDYLRRLRAMQEGKPWTGPLSSSSPSSLRP